MSDNMKNAYKNLQAKGHIGKMELKNRIVLPPMGTGYHDKGGMVSQRFIDYLEARAKGGVGLIIIEVTAPSIECNASNMQLCLGSDAHIPGFSKLAQILKSYGAKVAVQLQHSSWELMDGKPNQVGPTSAIVPGRAMGVMGAPHELTLNEVKERINWFATAAKRAQEAGLDGVEMHGAHQYLAASFLSGATNQRTDEYGGSVLNRARFMTEILIETRKLVGLDYPIWPRLNGQESGVEGGLTIEETLEMVPLFEEAGADAIHVSGYGAYSHAIHAPICDIPGFLIPQAEAVKKISRVPVIAVGRLDPDLGEEILEKGQADFISIGRRLIADPEMPNKTFSGNSSEIIPCINCMECIERPRTDGRGMACAVNALTGLESEYRILPADKSKKVIVLGGGPAGIQAGLVAQKRGHQVILFERKEEIGGLLSVAKLPPHKEDIDAFIDFMKSQMATAGIDLRTGVEATPEMIIEENPDAVVIAVGGKPIVPDIPGINNPNVTSAQEVLAGRKVGESIVIIGGGMVGCETAHYLAAKGHKVSIVEMINRLANDVTPMVRRRLLDGLREKQVNMLKSTTCEEITGMGVRVSTEQGEQKDIPADTIIIAVGYQANDSIYNDLKDKLPEVSIIGDAENPIRIREAIEAGFKAGLAL